MKSLNTLIASDGHTKSFLFHKTSAQKITQLLIAHAGRNLRISNACCAKIITQPVTKHDLYKDLQRSFFSHYGEKPNHNHELNLQVYK